jgi:hypothetical protein
MAIGRRRAFVLDLSKQEVLYVTGQKVRSIPFKTVSLVKLQKVHAYGNARWLELHLRLKTGEVVSIYAPNLKRGQAWTRESLGVHSPPLAAPYMMGG